MNGLAGCWSGSEQIFGIALDRTEQDRTEQTRWIWGVVFSLSYSTQSTTSVSPVPPQSTVDATLGGYVHTQYGTYQ